MLILKTNLQKGECREKSKNRIEDAVEEATTEESAKGKG
jgi:hypothetical protein